MQNAFSKILENHEHAWTVYFRGGNFVLWSTPAMKAGVADHLWVREELVGLLDMFNL